MIYSYVTPANKPNTVQWDATSGPQKNLPSFMSSRSSADDNLNRKEKVQESLDLYRSQIEALQKNDKSMLDMKGRVKENMEPLYRSLESIYSIYNLNVQLIFQDQSDSATRIEPILHPSKSMQLLMSIAVVLGKFPYSFIKAIDLSNITICQNIFLKKEEFESVYQSRVMANAIFTTDRHTSYAKIEKHFYKIILYHIDKKVASLHADWPLEKLVKSNSLNDKKKSSGAKSQPYLATTSLSSLSTRSLTSHGKFGSENVKFLSKDELITKEKTETFHKMMKFPKELLKSNNQKLQTKAEFIKEKMEGLDTIGIVDEWWMDLIKLDLKFIEESFDYFF